MASKIIATRQQTNSKNSFKIYMIQLNENRIWFPAFLNAIICYDVSLQFHIKNGITRGRTEDGIIQNHNDRKNTQEKLNNRRRRTLDKLFVKDEYMDKCI